MAATSGEQQETLKALYPDLVASEKDHDLDVGVVFELLHSCCSTPGHEFKLDALVRALDGSSKTTRLDDYPHRIELICDRFAYSKNCKRAVMFKYGKQTYRLAVETGNKSWWWHIQGRKWTAQDRVAEALGMNVNSGLKILCKGKVLFPNSKLEPEEISQQLISISTKDWETMKPSLVVMGTRIGNELNDGKGIVELFMEGWQGALQWGLELSIRVVQTALGALLWPLRNTGLLPSPPAGSHEE